MRGYNPAFPPICTDQNCKGTTREKKRNGDEWVLLQCTKCGAYYTIFGTIKTKKGDDHDWQEWPKGFPGKEKETSSEDQQ